MIGSLVKTIARFIPRDFPRSLEPETGGSTYIPTFYFLGF